MKKARYLLLALSYLVSAAALADAPEKVLFVGNSFTFYNDGLHAH